MPELPEVTTTINGINSLAKNLTIRGVWSDWPKLIRTGSFTDFAKEIKGLKILEANRRGKNILIKLSGEKTLLIHLKMTGYIMYGKLEDDERKKRFIHLILFLSNGYQLALSDVRKFAKITLLDTDKTEEYPYIKSLGPEPLDKQTTLKIFSERLNVKPRWPIKQALTNQELIAGIGNIYSDEILWEASIHPLQKVSEISAEKMEKIFTATKKILKKSIEIGGDSMSDYRNIHGKKGEFQNFHKAYRQTGERCPKKGCAGTITKIKIAGRSAHFCNEHQKLI